MHLPRIRWNSLSTRIVLGVLVAFLGAVWSLTWYASQSLRSELERRISEQQFGMLGVLAHGLQTDFDERVHTLRTVAKDIAPHMLLQPTALRQLLGQYPFLGNYFNDGVAILNAQGVVLASTAGAWATGGFPPAHTSALRDALEKGQITISAPLVDGATAKPYIVLAAPLLDGNGQSIGAVAGAVQLLDDNFLDDCINAYPRNGGDFFLVDLQARSIVTASDKRRILQALPPQGNVPQEDSFAQGKEGFAVYTNAQGVEVLGANHRLNSPAWSLMLTQPTSEVFAPVQQQQMRLFTAAGLLSALALLLGVPLLRRELRPLQEAARMLKNMREGHQPHQALPVPPQAEVGDVVDGFNHLLLTLTEREALLRDLFDTASVGILLVDTDMRLVQVNECMAEMFDCPMQDLLGMEYAELVDPSQRTMSRVRTQSLLDSALDRVDIDRLFIRRDGSTFWGRLTGRRIYWPNGQLRGLLGAITDITERKRLQQFESFRSQTLEKMAHDEPLDDILRHIVLGVEAISPGATCSCTQLTSDGKALGHCVSPHLPAFYVAAIQGIPIAPTHGSCGAAAALGQRVVVESIATHPNWAPFKELAAQAGFGACWSQPIIASDGRVLGTLAMYHAQPNTPSDADITIIEHSARLATVAIERSEASRRLRESEAHYRLLTEGVSDAVWRMDSDGIFTYMSPADERMRGYAAHEVVGHHVYELMTPESVETIKAVAKAHAASTGDADQDKALTFILEQKCKNGGTVWTEVRSTAERDAQGNIIGHRGITRDISERRKTEAQLQLAASVLTHAQEGIMITSPDGSILEVNAAFTDITGYRREEVLGANPRLLRSGHQGADFYAAMFHKLQLEGRWQGEVWNRHKNGKLFAIKETISAVHDSAGHLQHYVSLFSDITALKAQQLRLEHSAHFDALTDLPNRVLLMDRLQQAMTQAQRRGEPMALVFLDLDGFKAVNDQHGHALGDDLLCTLATRMRAALRDGDTLARLGGDEFVAILVDLPDALACIPLLQRLLQAASQAVVLESQTLQVSASLGVALYPQGAEVDANTLLHQADQAMYQAKLGGKNRYHLSPPLTESIALL